MLFVNSTWAVSFRRSGWKTLRADIVDANFEQRNSIAGGLVGDRGALNSGLLIACDHASAGYAGPGRVLCEIELSKPSAAWLTGLANYAQQTLLMDWFEPFGWELDTAGKSLLSN